MLKTQPERVEFASRFFSCSNEKFPSIGDDGDYKINYNDDDDIE